MNKMGKRIGIGVFLLCLLVSMIFSVQAMEVTPKMVQEAAYASMASYRGETEQIAGQHLKEQGWQVQYISNERNKFVVAEKVKNGHPYYLLGITGTEGKREWLINFRSSLVSYEGSHKERVHEGYYELAKQLTEEPVFQQISKTLQRDDKARLILTGHSLGGAVATIATRYGIDQGLLPSAQVEGIVFGSPLMGNEAFIAAGTPYPIVGFEIQEDVVPEIFQSYKSGYHGTWNQTVLWKSHTPDIALHHAMMRYLDEAVLQEIQEYKREAKQRQEGDYYVLLPNIQDTIGLDTIVTERFQWGLVQAWEEGRKETAYIDTSSPTMEKSLQRAKALGYDRVYGATITFIVKRESKVQNYYAIIERYSYSVSTGRVLTWSVDVCQSGTYSLLVAAMNRLSLGIREQGGKDEIFTTSTGRLL